MTTIHVKHIGPIVDSGEVRVTPVTLLIGKQSSGKSTLMKLLCYCCWVEKHVMLDGETLLYKYTHYGRFLKELKAFHRFDNDFFSAKSEFHFKGETLSIDLMPKSKNVKITSSSKLASQRYNEKICFVPSERNIVSAIQNVEKSYKSTDYDVLFNYILEYSEAKVNYTREHPIALPFDQQMAYYYDAKSNVDRVMVKKVNTTIQPIFASSGVQSALPLVILADYVMHLAGKQMKSSVSDITNAISKVLMVHDQDIRLEELSPDHFKRIVDFINYRRCMLFVEEPEQNLFPFSQFEMVRFLLQLLTDADRQTSGANNSIVMTTHSPYVLTSFNFFMKVSMAKGKIRSEDILGGCGYPELPLDYFSAYAINDEGRVEDIVDHEYNFIKGDYLDGLSDWLNEEEAKLDEIIYGQAD